MNDRMQRVLDGEWERDALTPSEAAELDESKALFASVLRSIPERPLPDLGAGVLGRIDAAEQSSISPRIAKVATRRPSGFMSWLWSPKRVTLPLRPAYALGIAATLAIIVGVRAVAPNDRAVAASAAPAATESREVLVQFRFEAPDARAVSLVGDFSNWAPTHVMTRSGQGVWTIVVPLEPGVHSYSFVVDGEDWVPDPAAPAVADGFGGMNSRIAVLASDAGRSL